MKNVPPPPPTAEALRAAFRQVHDPEFGLNVEDLGLIYDVRVADGQVDVVMTLTSPHCPAGEVIRQGVQAAAEALPGVTNVNIEVVWTPAWTPERLSRQARAALGWE